MTTLSEVKTRLARIQGNIEGVIRAEANAPKGLPGTDLPMFINFTGGSSFEESGEGADETFGIESRTLLMRLYVAPIQSGVVDGEAEAACEPFLERVRDEFLSRSGLGLWGIVDEDEFDVDEDGPLETLTGSQWLGDSGPVVMRYAGQEYTGIEFRLRVGLAVSNDYKRYE